MLVHKDSTYNIWDSKSRLSVAIELLHLHQASLFCPPSPSDLIHCTNELNVSIPHLADTLLERTSSNSWIVVFKALITTHHLMMYGNEVSPHA